LARCDINYSDKIGGREDLGIKRILGYGNKDGNASRLRSILLKVINNELTPRQKEIIMLYYFKDKDTTEIAGQLGVSPQAVSAARARARLRLFKVLRYYM
jgi:RNA polymerase sigma-70 factor (ECF subfamily)